MLTCANVQYRASRETVFQSGTMILNGAYIEIGASVKVSALTALDSDKNKSCALTIWHVGESCNCAASSVVMTKQYKL